jgi:predicted amidophosphoribosyltransferase
MAEIIPIAERLLRVQQQEAAAQRDRKVQVIEKTLLFTPVEFRCEKCGGMVEPHAGGEPHRVPYRFCETCGQEYRDFIARLQGAGDPGRYWQNEDWQSAWRSWIDYQGNLDRFIKSKEFLQLVQELKTTGSDG